MGTVSTTLPADGQTIDASDVNTPINAILAEFNGNIDNDNIKTGANISGAKLGAGTLPGTAFDTTLASGWLDLADVPDTVTNNGNRSYDLVFNSNDLTDTVSEGQRLRLTRTVSAPTQCTDLEASSTNNWSKSSASGLATGTTWTWKAKIKPESYTAGTIAAIDDGTNRMEIRQSSSGQLSIAGGTAAAEDIVTSYQSVVLSKWQDVSCSITIGTPTGEIIIDDAVVPSFVTASAATTMTIGTPTIYVGRNAAGNYYDGKIQSLWLFNAVISAATLKTYSGQIGTGSETNVEGYWSFNGNGNDSSANANNLTANSGATATNVDSPFGSYLGGTYEYGIITKTAFSTNTTLTVQVPEGCAIPTSGGVSAVAYSTQKAPYKFPNEKKKWKLASIWKNDTVTTSNATYGAFSSGGWALTVPTGGWTVGWVAQFGSNVATEVVFNISSTALTGLARTAGANASNYGINVIGTVANYIEFSGFVQDEETLSAPATFVMYTIGATTNPQISGSRGLTEIFANFAYL